LTAEQLRNWHADIAKAPARTRTAKGDAQRHRKAPTTEDGKRARRATANRIMALLRASLNYAFLNEKVASDSAWRKVKPFKSVTKSRNRYLSLAESKRLINACDPEFRPMIEAALLCGARYGQLAKASVGDFAVDTGTLTLSTRKGTGGVRTYHVH